jgi:hypothetical protein
LGDLVSGFHIPCFLVIASWDRRLDRRPALDEAFGPADEAVFWRAVGAEVGFSLVRESPVASWTRVAWITHIGA